MRIRKFEASLNSVKVDTVEIKKLELKPQPRRNSGRTYNTEKQLHTRWLAQVFEDNEFLAYEGRALTNIQIQRNFLEAFKRNQQIRYRFKTYRATIGMYRKSFNEQKLFASQPPPYLLSFQYDDCGYIVIGGVQQTTYMSFEECYQRCLDFKIADPRFVPYDAIVAIRNKQQDQLISGLVDGDEDWTKWIIPNDDIIKRLSTKIGCELYNSVKFQIGWTREDTPIDGED